MRSAPELYSQLEREALARAVGAVHVVVAEPERALRWRSHGASGTARLEPAGWGTRVTLTAEIEERVADQGTWRRLGPAAPEPRRAGGAELEQRLNALLDDLGTDSKKPFQRE